MKKKIFLQLNIGWQILSFFTLILGIVCSVLTIKLMLYKINWLSILLFFITIFLIYTFIRCEHNVIVFSRKEVLMPGDWLWREHKIQFRTVIKYNEIQNVSIIRSEKNSINKSIKGITLASGVIKPYLEFTMKNNEKKRLFIMYFTKEQKVKIIKEVLKRTAFIGNELKIENG